MKVKSKMLEKKKINRFEYRCLLFGAVICAQTCLNIQVVVK